MNNSLYVDIKSNLHVLIYNCERTNEILTKRSKISTSKQSKKKYCFDVDILELLVSISLVLSQLHISTC